MKICILFAVALARLLNGTGGPKTANLAVDRNKATVERGWLFPSGGTKIVRFISETKVEGHPKVYVPFQTSGFIFLLNNTFSVSVAQPDAVLQFKYKDGALSKIGSDLFVDRHPDRLTFADAISRALDEAACDGIGDFCKMLLSWKGSGLGRNQNGILASGGSFEAVVGNGPGALQRFVVTWPNAGQGIHKTICSFTVVFP